ncbi:MAG: hypothetical protein QM662_18355 [Gordonia sp. (in: high G+C Gram-positive bacteria)]
MSHHEIPAIATERTTPDDDLFVRMEHALGLPVVNQGVWHLPQRWDRAAFDALAHQLRQGRLSRLLIRSRWPVRDRWHYTPDAGSAEYATTTVGPDEAAAWAGEQARYGLNSVSGPAWRLTAADAQAGGTFVSWVGSHVIGDGGAVITAISEAIDGRPFDTGTTEPGPLGTVAEIVDALGASAAAAYRLVRHRSTPVPRPPATPVARADEAGWTGISPTAIRMIPVRAFADAAAAAGGTPNTLFMAIVVGILAATGRVADGDEVPVNLPMSTRTPGDRRANASTGVTARVVVSGDRYRDLRPLRAAGRQAFGSLADGPGALALLGTLAHPLGDRLVRMLAGDATAPLCLASNLGELPLGFAALGTGAPGPVAVRSVTAGASSETIRAMAGGISAWASTSAGVVTLCVSGLDPDRVTGDAALSALVVDELGRWDLPSAPWGALR